MKPRPVGPQMIEGGENVLVRLRVTLFIRLAARMHDLMPFSVISPFPPQTFELNRACFDLIETFAPNNSCTSSFTVC